jgi:glutathione S-transferase
MKLYYKKAACSLIVRIILNEVKATFESSEVDLKTKKYDSDKDYRTINPKGSVPALVLEDGAVLTENAVILQYLANRFQKTDLLPTLDNFEHYRVLEWLNFIATDVHKGFSPLFNPNVPENIKELVFKPMLKTKFAYINQHLERHPYLNGHEFSIADAYLYVMIRWAIGLNIKLNDLSHFSSYLANLHTRASIKISLEQEELPTAFIE